LRWAGTHYVIYQNYKDKFGIWLEGYVEFRKVKHFGSLKYICKEADWSMRTGTQTTAIHYVTRPVEGCVCVHCTDMLKWSQHERLDSIVECGVKLIITGQGFRSDLYRGDAGRLVQALPSIKSCDHTYCEQECLHLVHGPMIHSWSSSVDKTTKVIIYYYYKFKDGHCEIKNIG